MAEKKATTKTAAAKPAAAKTTRTACKKAATVLNAENAGFKAGDVYQALPSC